MNAWTSAARDELNRFLSAIRQPLEHAGADAGEVIEDIRRHIDEEIATAQLGVVTVTELKPMLARIGEPWRRDDWDEREVGCTDKVNGALLLQALRSGEGTMVAEPIRRQTLATPEQNEKETPPKTPAPKLSKRDFPTRRSFLALVFGVFVPALTLGIEWVTGFCAGEIFNPIPTWGHVFLVALVPAINFTVWRVLMRGTTVKRPGVLSFGMGLSIGIAIVYSVVFVPLIFPGVIALMFFGLGLLPLAPYFALGAGLHFRKVLNRRFGSESGIGAIRFWPGILAGILAFLIVDIPHIATTAAMRRAAAPSSEESGLRLLRTLGHRETVLRACYPAHEWGRDRNGRGVGTVLFWLLPSHYGVTTEQARRIYFQLYGRAFNAEPAPGPRTASLVGFERTPFDPERGGEKVGSPVPGLSMQSSRIDATVEPNGALAYLEWIFEFRNEAATQSEARFEVALPPGAVVSRLTLWINGEEREAAFAGKAEVRSAYQNIVAQRRDPVLVTTSGRDRVLVQCFPVMPGGGVMKARVGMTVPLLLDGEKNGILRWPYVRERNFALEEKLEHSFWIDSPVAVESLGVPLQTERTARGHFMARGHLNEEKTPGLQPAVLIRRDELGDSAWVLDSRKNDGSRIEQIIRARQNVAVKDVVLLIDGSASMGRVQSELERIRPTKGGSITIVHVGEGIREFVYDGSDASQQELRKLKFRGGQDNVPALERAWDLAAANGSGAVLWLHGPQPVLLSTAEGLRQRFERRPNAVKLLDLPIERAPNVITQELPTSARYETVSMHRPAVEMVNTLVRELTGASTQYEGVREKNGEIKAREQLGAESNLHLARLWALDEVRRLIRSGRTSAAIALATQYHLVTEVSGAVVLETAEQYKAARLQPVDPNLVPTVPEPGTWALLICGLVLMAVIRRRVKIARQART